MVQKEKYYAFEWLLGSHQKACWGWSLLFGFIAYLDTLGLTLIFNLRRLR
jgi:hypothetical protein